MSSTTDKLKGLANEAVGNVKQGSARPPATTSSWPRARPRS